MLTANIFALMGLRQLYFLIGDLLKRLVYLSYGLAFLLLFIGVKLVLHAMHENTLPFINGGEHISWAPDIPIWVSLVVIVGTLVVTTVAQPRRRPPAQRHARPERPVRPSRRGPSGSSWRRRPAVVLARPSWPARASDVSRTRGARRPCWSTSR